MTLMVYATGLMFIGRFTHLYQNWQVKMSRVIMIALCAAVLFAGPVAALAEEEVAPSGGGLPSLPSISIGIEDANGGVQTLSVSIQILLLMTVLSLAPAILIMCTSFTRIIVVLSFMRQALGIQQTPSNQILISLALFLTFFIMAPVWTNVNENALQPFLEKSIGHEEAIAKAVLPIKKFMLNQTREKDLELFIGLSEGEPPAKPIDLSIATVTPAFIISELKTAFQIGFMIYVPFLVLDMVISSILMSMGMMMLPPIIISLPFKLMLFVLSDGWYLLVGSFLQSFK